MEPIFDWKGNEVKPGDEVCIIQTIDRQMFTLAGQDPAPDKPCWHVGAYYKVDADYCITSVFEDYTFTQFLKSALLFTDMSCNILAIKGVSDQKPTYE
jgi:hypothetical protein